MVMLNMAFVGGGARFIGLNLCQLSLRVCNLGGHIDAGSVINDTARAIIALGACSTLHAP